jgi:hypothetical protein
MIPEIFIRQIFIKYHTTLKSGGILQTGAWHFSAAESRAALCSREWGGGPG